MSTWTVAVLSVGAALATGVAIVAASFLVSTLVGRVLRRNRRRYPLAGHLSYVADRDRLGHVDPEPYRPTCFAWECDAPGYPLPGFDNIYACFYHAAEVQGAGR